MKKLKNGCHFFNIDLTEKCPITNPQSLGLQFSECRQETEYQCQPLWKNWKMAAISLISILQKNFQLPTPQSLGLQFSESWWKWNISIGHYDKNWKMAAISLILILQKNFQLLIPTNFGSPVFWVLTEMEYQCQPLLQKLKNGCHFFNIDLTEKFPINDPLPKFWVSSFLSVDGNRISASTIMKKLKNGCHFFNINLTEKFPITDPPPPKVWVSCFPSVDGNGISVSVIMKKLKNGCHFVNIDLTEKFPITDPPKVWVSSFLFWVLMETEYHQKTGDAANFLFSEFSIGSFFPSPILGSISTFMCGYT